MQVKLIIIIVSILAVFGVLGGIYGSLKLTISDREKENTGLKENNSTLVAQLATEKLNVIKLKSVITNVNHELDKMSINNKSIEKELQKWKQGHVEVTNKNKVLEQLLDAKMYLNESCQTGLQINELLGAMKYEDL